MSIFCRHDWIYRVEVLDTELKPGAPTTVWRKCSKCHAFKFYFSDKPTLISREPTKAEMIERFNVQMSESE